MSSSTHPLEFELPLVELESELERVKDEIASGNHQLMEEYAKLEKKVEKARADIFGKLTPYQRVQLSRHADRPFTLDYIKFMIHDFVELHGDRLFRDDAAIVGGLGKLGTLPVMIIGHQRGRSMEEKITRNFGMPQPEGYRKALRLIRLAEKFELPIITLIDTQGAYPGLEAEERGQAEAIATNLLELCEVTVPVVCVVIGEGGSGGALAIGVGDRILMLENACYSVITPEGCASILWHQNGDSDNLADNAAKAAEALRVTASDLLELGVIDEVVAEPLGGAHRNHSEAADLLAVSLTKHLTELGGMTVGDLIEKRYNKFRQMGVLAA